jgi:hypothetical protein
MTLLNFLVLTCKRDFCIFLILERIESNLLKINWLRGVIRLHSNNAGVLEQVFIVSHSYQTYFNFLGSDHNLNCELRYQMITITRFTSIIILNWRQLSSFTGWTWNRGLPFCYGISKHCMEYFPCHQTWTK